MGNAWVGNELRVVKGNNIPVALTSLRAPSSTFHASADVDEMDRETHLLYPLSIIKVLLSFVGAALRFRGRFMAAFGNALFSRRESMSVRIKCLGHFVVACQWACDLDQKNVDLIHSQWIHSCGTVGMYAAWLLDVPFGFTGHAADLFRERCALRDKIQRADYIICISYFHRDFYLIYGARPEQLKIAYCGIDVERFSYSEPQAGRNDVFTILASGRLVEKKGFKYLIEACKLLQDRIEYKCVIAGSGELNDELNQQIKALGLQGQVRVTGEPLMQEEITEFMRSGDCYCLPCVWASDNDVDGLPQMLMEAMACGLPVISTRLVGIPDLVIDHDTGILIEPNKVEEIAEAIVELNESFELRQTLSRRGRSMVERKFNLNDCLDPLINEYKKRVQE